MKHGLPLLSFPDLPFALGSLDILLNSAEAISNAYFLLSHVLTALGPERASGGGCSYIPLRFSNIWHSDQHLQWMLGQTPNPRAG